MLRKLRALIAVTLLTFVVASTSGCAGPWQGANDRDLEGVPVTEPSKIAVMVNIDKHPNVSMFCLGPDGEPGVAFYTVSQDQIAPYQQERLTRFPQMDDWCAQ